MSYWVLVPLYVKDFRSNVQCLLLVQPLRPPCCAAPYTLCTSGISPSRRFEIRHIPLTPPRDPAYPPHTLSRSGITPSHPLEIWHSPLTPSRDLAYPPHTLSGTGISTSHPLDIRHIPHHTLSISVEPPSHPLEIWHVLVVVAVRTVHEIVLVFLREERSRLEEER